MNSQVSDYGGNLFDLAKVVMNMQALLDESVLLEIHTDKAKGTPKENARLVQTNVLLSAFREGNLITPVQFEIKQYIDNNNRLYLAVALTKIEIGVMGDTALTEGERTRLLPISNISIPELLKKINPSNKNFFKYIPDSLLTTEQIAAKRIALDEENRKYRKFQYSYSSDKKGAPRTTINIAVNLQLRNRSQFKIYTKENAEQIISGIACSTLSFNDGTQGVIKNKGELVDLMWRRLNSTDEGKRGGVALDFADFEKPIVKDVDGKYRLLFGYEIGHQFRHKKYLYTFFARFKMLAIVILHNCSASFCNK